MNDVDKKEVFAHLIDRLEPLAGLTPEERDLAVQRGEILSFEAGQSIFRQGEWDDFEYFVLQGEVETFAGGERIKWIAAHHKEATQPIAPSQPRAVTAKAGTPVVILRLPSMIEDDLLDVPGAQPESWTDALLALEVFKRIPAANVNRILDLMEPIEVRAGDVIIRQGTSGDFFFLIRRGSALVTRTSGPRSSQVKLAELEAGASFGEEALVSDAKRNATISMLTDGMLMRLSKKNFNRLIRDPALDSTAFADAQALVAQGVASWLDVRQPEEHEESGIAGSLNIPFDEVRKRRRELPRGRTYIVYCDTGRQSAAAAFLLTEAGLKASYLEKGLIHSLLAIRAHDAAPAQTPLPTPAPARSVNEAPRANGDGPELGDATGLEQKLLSEIQRNAELENALAEKTEALESLTARIARGQEDLQREAEEARALATAAEVELNKLVTELAEAKAAAHVDAHSYDKAAAHDLFVARQEAQLKAQELQEVRLELQQALQGSDDPSADETNIETMAILKETLRTTEQALKDKTAAHDLLMAHQGSASRERAPDVSEELSALRDANSALEAKLSKVLDDTQTGIDEERARHEATRDTLRQREAEVEKSKADHAEMERRLRELQARNDELASANEATQLARSASDEGARAELQSANEQLVVATQRAAQLETQIAQAEQDFESLHETLEAAQANANVAGERSQALEAELATQRADYANVLQTLDIARSQLQEHQDQAASEIEELRGAATKTAEQLDKAADETNRVNAARLDLEKQLGASTARTDQLTDELEATRSQIEALQANAADIESLSEQLSTAEQRATQLSEELEAALKGQTAGEEELARARTASADAEERLRTAEQRLNVMDGDLNEARQAVAKAQQEHAALATEHEGKAAQLDALREELATALEALDTSTNARSALEEQLAEQRDKAQRAHESATALENELRDDLEQTRRSLQARESERDSIAAELTAAQGDFEATRASFTDAEVAATTELNALKEQFDAVRADSLQAANTAREEQARLEQALQEAQSNSHTEDAMQALEDKVAQLESEREAIEQKLLENDVIIDTERAKSQAEISRIQRLRDDATERLRAERRAMALEAKEADQQLQLALKLRSEAEAAMNAAVQLVKERGLEPATVPVGVVDQNGHVRAPKRSTD